MRGSKSDLVIKQGEAENYKPTLYVISKEGENFESNLEKALKSIQDEYPGIESDKISDSKWKILIPEVLKIGHEAHFGQVTDNFLKYYKDGQLPVWEVPNMITKYYTTTQAYKKALE